jgi:hypothetical protein
VLGIRLKVNGQELGLESGFGLELARVGVTLSSWSWYVKEGYSPVSLFLIRSTGGV